MTHPEKKKVRSELLHTVSKSTMTAPEKPEIVQNYNWRLSKTIKMQLQPSTAIFKLSIKNRFPCIKWIKPSPMHTYQRQINFFFLF